MTDKTYRIKPLEWEPTGVGDNCQAWTAFGYIHIQLFGERWYIIHCARTVTDYYDSLEDGKAKAEVWFHERILPALEEVQQ